MSDMFKNGRTVIINDYHRVGRPFTITDNVARVNERIRSVIYSKYACRECRKSIQPPTWGPSRKSIKSIYRVNGQKNFVFPGPHHVWRTSRRTFSGTFEWEVCSPYRSGSSLPLVISLRLVPNVLATIWHYSDHGTNDVTRV